MASKFSRNGRYLGELQSAESVKSTPAQALALVKTDVARQAALADKSKWRMAAVVLSGMVLYLMIGVKR